MAETKIGIGDMTPDIDWTKWPYNTLVGPVVVKPPPDVRDKYKLPELIEVDILPHKLDDPSPPGKVTRVKRPVPAT